MKNLNKIFAIVGCITAVVAAIVTAAAVLNYFEKKKQDYGRDKQLYNRNAVNAPFFEY